MRILTLPACLVLIVAPPLHAQAAPTAQPKQDPSALPSHR